MPNCWYPEIIPLRSGGQSGCENGCISRVFAGGLVGCETALHLVLQGKKVTIVEVADALMSGGAMPAPIPSMLYMTDRLAAEGVRVCTGSGFKRLENGRAVISTPDGECAVDCDTVVQAVGFASESVLFDRLEAESPVTVWNIGDSKVPGNVVNAVRDGFFVAKNI